MFFDKKVWLRRLKGDNDFEKEIEKWEREEEEDDKSINNLEKLKIAAQIIKTVIKDEEEKTGCTKYKAVDKIFTYLRTLIY